MNSICLYFYGVNAWKKLVKIRIISIFVVFLLGRFAGPSWLRDALVNPGTGVGGQAVPSLGPMDVVPVTAALWR